MRLTSSARRKMRRKVQKQRAAEEEALAQEGELQPRQQGSDVSVGVSDDENGFPTIRSTAERVRRNLHHCWSFKTSLDV